MKVDPAKKQSFVRGVYPGVVAALATNPSAWSPMTAWAAFESGWGTVLDSRIKKNGTNDHNLFNLTAGSTWKGPTVPGPDTEYDPSGKAPRPITQKFRCYSSYAASVQDVLTLLVQPRFVAARDGLLKGTPDWVRLLATDALRQKHLSYYTLPTAEYVGGYQGTLSAVQELLVELKLSPSA